MRTITIKIENSKLDECHMDFMSCDFVQYLGKSRIDSNNMYKIRMYDEKLQNRLYKLKKITNRMGIDYRLKISGNTIYNFLDKYPCTTVVSVLEDHIPNFNNTIWT